MLSALLKKQLQEIFRSYFYNAKQGKARSRVSTVGYFAFFAVLMVGVLGGMFTYLAHSLCAPFAAAGMEWLYFTIMAMVAIVHSAAYSTPIRASILPRITTCCCPCRSRCAPSCCPAC